VPKVFSTSPRAQRYAGTELVLPTADRPVQYRKFRVGSPPRPAHEVTEVEPGALYMVSERIHTRRTPRDRFSPSWKQPLTMLSASILILTAACISSPLEPDSPPQSAPEGQEEPGVPTNPDLLHVSPT